MPRQPRLDAPETLHHVMVRGIERRVLFRDDPDRGDFVARLATLAAQEALTVYAWALLPNHAHLLVRTGTRPLPRSMRALLTGCAARPLAPVPGVSPQAVYQAVARGRADRAMWERLLKADT